MSVPPAFAVSVGFMVSSVRHGVAGMRLLRPLLELLQALDGIRGDGLQERLAVACVERLLRL